MINSKIYFQCSCCHTNYSVPAEKAGKEGKCKNCGDTVRIPTSEQIGDGHKVGEDSSQNESNLLIRTILAFAMVLSILVWAVVGFIIYIPMLFRITAFYCGMVVLSAFDQGENLDLRRAQQKLDYVTHIYPDRFIKIVESFEKRDKITLPPHDKKSITIGWKDFLKSAATDIAWTLIFWLSALGIFFI